MWKMKVPRRASLDKYMPPVLGWDRLRPLPSKFTALPDCKKRKRRMMIINPLMEPLIPDGRPTVIDLFSGCGGFSLGFILAGFRVIAAVDFDFWSHITYCNNIPHIQEAPLHMYFMDIHNLTGREILHNAGVKEVDCVVGSPPCQGFSQIGKREIGDKRDLLLWQFGRLIKELQPKTWVMENVKGIKTKKLPDGTLVLDSFMKYMNTKTENDVAGLITKHYKEILC